MTPLQSLKPHRRALTASAVILGLGLLAALLHGYTSLQNQRQQLDAFGQTLARSAAQRAVDATLSQDMISLQVILQELNRHPHVVGATIHDVENQLLVQSGFAPGEAEGERFQRFGAPVALGENIAGHLQIAVTTPALTMADRRFFGFWALAVVLVAALPWVVPVLPARSGPAKRPADPQRDTDPPPDAEDTEASELDEAEEPAACLRLRLQLANLETLYRQLNRESFDQQVDRFEQQLQGVLSLYGGRKVALSDNVLLIDYAGENTADCAFRALCSAQLLGELSHLSPGPKLKLRARIHPLQDTVPSPLSEAFFDQLSDVQAPVNGIEIAPSLIDDELHKHLELDPENGLLIGIKPPYRQLLNKQQQQLQRLALADGH